MSNEVNPVEPVDVNIGAVMGPGDKKADQADQLKADLKAKVNTKKVAAKPELVEVDEEEEVVFGEETPRPDDPGLNRGP